MCRAGVGAVGVCDPRHLRIVKVERIPMCRWCLLPILLFTGGGLHAQRGGLELLVLDSVERAPVPGAEVRWDQRERQRIGRTDTEGRILIPEDPGRTSVITIALVGYATRTISHTWTTAEGRVQRTVRTARGRPAHQRRRAVGAGV